MEEDGIIAVVVWTPSERDEEFMAYLDEEGHWSSDSSQLTEMLESVASAERYPPGGPELVHPRFTQLAPLEDVPNLTVLPIIPEEDSDPSDIVVY